MEGRDDSPSLPQGPGTGAGRGWGPAGSPGWVSSLPPGLSEGKGGAFASR